MGRREPGHPIDGICPEGEGRTQGAGLTNRGRTNRGVIREGWSTEYRHLDHRPVVCALCGYRVYQVNRMWLHIQEGCFKVGCPCPWPGL